MKFKTFKGYFKQNFVYILRHCTKVGSFKKDDLNEFFEEGYKETDEFSLMFTSLINSVFTHMSKTFIMSRATLYYSCYHDPNLKEKLKIHSGNYSTFLSFCFENGILKRLREPTGRKGGVYQISDPDIVKKMYEIQSQIFFEEQEEYVTRAYDSNEKLIYDKPLKSEDLPTVKEEYKASFIKRINEALPKEKK